MIFYWDKYVRYFIGCIFNNNYKIRIQNYFLNFFENLLHYYFCTNNFISIHLKNILCFIIASFLVLVYCNLELFMDNLNFLTLIIPMISISIIYYYEHSLVKKIIVNRLTLGFYFFLFILFFFCFIEIFIKDI